MSRFVTVLLLQAPLLTTTWHIHLAFATMAEIPKRNVHVFSSSNGVEVAGELSGSSITCISSKTMQGFFQHGGVSISTLVGWINEVCYIPVEWALYPCQFDNNRAVGGMALDSGSGNEIPPGRYVIRTLPPGEALLHFLVPPADTNVIESAQVNMFLTTDVPRTRAYSVDHTPHVRFPGTVYSQLVLLIGRLGYEFRDGCSISRRSLLHWGSSGRG